jgi:hypothetical protein
MKKGVLLTGLLLALAVHPQWVKAQGCSMCTKTAAGLDDKSAKGLNGGILYLAVLPLTILSTIGFIWWRHNNGK